MADRMLCDCMYEGALKKDIVDADRCCRCGTCGAVCPKHATPRRYNPLLKGTVDSPTHPSCNLCQECCPVCNPRTVAGAGTVLRSLAARAAEGHRNPSAQDGGACSAFLSSLEGYEIASVGHKTWHPIPDFSAPKSTPAGTVYAATSSLSLLPKKRGTVAFVGMPCQMRGITLAQERGLLPEIALKVGLFCTSTFDHALLKNIIGEKGIRMDDVVSMRIKSSLRITTSSGESHELRLRELSEAVVPGCAYCPDFCAWDADIAFGSVGSADGITSVLIRTERAERLFEEAVRRNYINEAGTVDMQEIELHQDRKARKVRTWKSSSQ